MSKIIKQIKNNDPNNQLRYLSEKILITGAYGDINFIYKILKKLQNKFLIDGMDCKSNGPGSFF